eukprot:768058-Hanusia_phi.AAC.2
MAFTLSQTSERVISPPTLIESSKNVGNAESGLIEESILTNSIPATPVRVVVSPIRLPAPGLRARGKCGPPGRP